MTEVDWLTTDDLGAMVRHVAPKVGLRKARLFAAASCRRAWGDMADPRSRRAVEAAELYADGLLDEASWEAAVQGAEAACDAVRFSADNCESRPAYHACVAASFATKWHPDPVMGTAWHVVSAAGRRALGSASRAEAEREEFEAVRQLLREVVGNPFRPPAISPTLLCWSDGTIPRLAAGIYEAREFSQDSMGVLADALEEAGCGEAAVLSHLRGPGPHVRGCWALDVALGLG